MRFLKRFLFFIVLAAIAAGSFYGVGLLLRAATEEEKPTPTPAHTTSTPAVTTSPAPTGTEPEGARIPTTEPGSVQLVENVYVSDLVEAVLPSIVQIESNVTGVDVWGRTQTESTLGSGIILSQKDDILYIATNNHVVSGATKVSVTFSDGSTAAAALLGTDPGGDLAIVTAKLSDLSEETKGYIAVAKLATAAEPKPGNMVIAVGNALGYGNSVTVGFVSAIRGDFQTTYGERELIQTDAAINPGNSGGALVNLQGEVIGINSAKYTATSVEGMGFAIPITQAIPVLEELSRTEDFPSEQTGFLGVYIVTVTAEMQTTLGWPRGVYVKEIIPGGAAETAGILPGDIVLSVNDINVYENSQLINRVTSYRAGTEVMLRLSRETEGGREEITLPVVLKENAQ
ncbi:MAG: trypsin-like peptidase domain-containing protein [Lachnospiraceae bacterium]|nr:trypsin-like peptidase domain-containing protein [Lachnospiraceae bacterium]